MTRVERSDFGGVLSAHMGNRVFLDSIGQAAGGAGLIDAIYEYIQFNSVFGGGVAYLAGTIAVRQDLFRDPEEPAIPLADRSGEVAAPIFYAAVDEFGDHTAGRGTHRALAQATLRSAAAFFGFGPDDLNRMAQAGSSRFSRMVMEGYGMGREADDESIFRAIGFHLGSELLADEEFRVLDSALSQYHPDLVGWLRQDRVPVGAAHVPAYLWVAVHTTVEAEHLDAGLEAANRALRYYAGRSAVGQARAWIIHGFRDFAAVQSEFMGSMRGGVAAAGCCSVCA